MITELNIFLKGPDIFKYPLEISALQQSGKESSK